MPEKTNLETIVWPSAPSRESTYKVVQFTADGEDYLRFGPVSEFHALISKEFFRDFNASVVGAGLCMIDFGKKVAHFYGRSQLYNLGIDKERLEAVRPSDWNFEVAD